MWIYIEKILRIFGTNVIIIFTSLLGAWAILKKQTKQKQKKRSLSFYSSSVIAQNNVKEYMEETYCERRLQTPLRMITAVNIKIRKHSEGTTTAAAI